MSFLLIKNLFYLEVMLIAGYAIFFACLKVSVRRELGMKPLILFAGLAAACFLAPNLWVLHLLFIATVPLLARSREQIGLVLLASLLATPTLSLDLSIGNVPIFGLAAQGSLALGALIAMRIHPGRGAGMPALADLPALLILILLVVIGASDTSFTHWLRQTAAVTVAWALPYYVVTRTLSSPEGNQRACTWLAAATCMLAVVVIYERYSFWPLYTALNETYGIIRGQLELIVKVRDGLIRAEGPMEEATAMGFILVIGLAAAFVSRRIFRSRGAYLLMLALIGFSLLAPQSRGGWLGAGVAIVAASLYRLRGRSVLALTLPALVAGGLAYGALTYGQSEGAVDGSREYRALLWERGVEEFKERPLLGDSNRDVLAQMQDLVQGEGMVDFVNSYLYFALLTGSVGLLMFVTFLGLPSIRLWRARRRLPRDGPELDLAAFCFGTLMAAAVMLALTSFIPRAALIVMIAAGFAGRLAHRPRADSQLKPSSPSDKGPSNERLRHDASHETDGGSGLAGAVHD